VRVRRVGAQQHLQVAGTIDDRGGHVVAVGLALRHRGRCDLQRELERDVAFGEDLAMATIGTAPASAAATSTVLSCTFRLLCVERRPP